MAKKKIIRERKKPQAVSPQGAIVPIKWNIPDTMHSVYANNILVLIMENEFNLSFFETKTPIRINESDPLPTDIRADCVASVILHPKKVLSLIDALQRQVNVFIEREQRQEQVEVTGPTEPGDGDKPKASPKAQLKSKFPLERPRRTFEKE